MNRPARTLAVLWRCSYRTAGYHGRWIYNESWPAFHHADLRAAHAPDTPLARRLLQALPEP